MIYFLDNSLQLQKIVTSKNVISAIHEHELNGLIRADVELDLSYANKFLVLGIDHVGYYYKDEFYLHKIQRVEYDHVNETAMVVLRHIFFEDMIFGKLIRDVRPQNQDALTVSRQTIDANTRWQTIMTDVTGRLSTNFYWQVPYEVIEFMTENYRIEYLPKILFDGKKINGFQLHLANKIGEDKNIRIPYGSRVLDLKYEEDYSEIITKLVVHGKGEEVGDGYGRRINISDVNFSKNGVVSPVGSLYLEDKSITNTYGNDGQTPREGREVFEDIEDANELAEAGYQHYLQVSRPQMLFTADVADIGDVGIGDSVMIIRREYDVYFKARIHKLSVDLLYPEDAQVELGDYEHFKESKIARKTRNKNNRIQRQLSDRITRLKQEANDRFDNEVKQWFEEYEQALIDVHAEIEADRENMTNLINEKTTEFDESLQAGMAEAERKRQENYEAMSNYVNTTVDTTRSELETSINTSIESAKSYAEQQAQEKSDAVKNELKVVTNGHQQMLDDLESNVMNIDDFIGDKSVGLNELLYNERLHIEERINSINTWHYNLLKETQTLDDNFWEANNGEIVRSSPVSYFRKTGTANISTLRSKQEMFFEAGETYTLTFEVQTFGHRRMDYVWILNRDTTIASGNYNLVARADEQNAQVIYFGSNFRRYFITFTMEYDFYGVIQIGGNAVNNEVGISEYRIRKPYLTQSDNRNWLYHPDDNTQSIEEITRRITQLEDGREEFITRTQYDFETGEIEGSIKNIIETVDESTLIMQNHENWILTNGASIERTVEGFDSKVWLSDIHNPNMIPYSRFLNAKNIESWGNWRAPLLTKYGDEWLRVRNMNSGSNLGATSPKIPDKITAGQTYTISWEAFFNLSETRISSAFNYMYVVYSNNDNRGLTTPRIVGTKNVTVDGVVRLVNTYELTFTAHHSDNNASILFGTATQSGQDNWFFMRYPKLEVGGVSTPYFNAFSNLSQRADEISLAVQGIDMSGFLSQSDIQIVPDYVQLGSQRIDGSNIGSLLRVSPTGIDAVAEAMRLSGDLYVDGDITALAVKAIEGNFARLFANNLTADVINGAHIKSNTIEIKHLTGYDAILEVLMARTVFSNEVTAKVGNYIDINAGNIVTAGLSANVIEADHIQMGTALVDKIFATSARIDQLITKTHFVNEMHALTLNVVDLNASQIRARLLTANVIEAEWLKSGTALLDRVFSSTAMFERMMAKSAFVTTLNTVSIDTDQITIRRYDGVPVIDRGSLNFNLNVPLEDFWSEYINWTGQWYEHSGAGWQTYKSGSFRHEGRRLVANMLVRLSGFSPSASEWMYVRIRPYGQNTIGIPTVERRILVRNGVSEAFDLEVDLGRPTFARGYFYIEFRKESLSDGGTHADNIVQTRTNRVWQEG